MFNQLVGVKHVFFACSFATFLQPSDQVEVSWHGCLGGILGDPCPSQLVGRDNHHILKIARTFSYRVYFVLLHFVCGKLTSLKDLKSGDFHVPLLSLQCTCLDLL